VCCASLCCAGDNCALKPGMLHHGVHSRANGRRQGGRPCAVLGGLYEPHRPVPAPVSGRGE
jgi:hypothetical protein